MTTKRVHQILLAVTALAIVTSLLGLFLANSKLTKLADQTAIKKAEIQVTQSQIEAYEKTKLSVQSLDYVDELANKVLPAGKDESSIVAELSQFAQRSKLSVEQITFNEVTTTKSTSKDKTTTVIPKGVTVVPITVQLKSGGKFENLLEFLKSIEGNQRTMQVTNITLGPDEEDRTRLSQITVAINLYTKGSN